ncbi:MoCo/4Fe-4S cofactor protein with predicted Tat translocation signal [Bradyrhizobium sp. LB9.1b]
MKRRIDHQPRTAGGEPLWAGIEELSDDPRFQAFIEAEYPAVQQFSKTARREFLRLMGASFALAGLTGCEKSSLVAALPYVDQPAAETLGLPRYYATAVLLDGFAQPVIATAYAGRPTKLDGNPGHPVTQGRSDIFMQSAVLQLYDPDRAAAPTRHGEPASWSDVETAIGIMRESWRVDAGEGVRLLLGPTTSPTLLRQIETFLKQFPNARVHRHSAAGADARRQIAAAVYGQALDLHYVLGECDFVVSLDDDFLGPGPDQVRNALGWSQARRRSDDRPGNRLLMAESVPSATGAMAGQRLVAEARRHAAAGGGAGRRARRRRRVKGAVDGGRKPLGRDRDRRLQGSGRALLIRLGPERRSEYGSLDRPDQ